VGMTALRARDGVGQRRHRLGNGTGCTTSCARGGRRCCGLENSVAGLGTAPVWSMVLPARVREDGGA
jgi:hypothetical protein